MSSKAIIDMLQQQKKEEKKKRKKEREYKQELNSGHPHYRQTGSQLSY
jgi:hypothetical protein